MARTLPFFGDAWPLLRDPVGFLAGLPARGELVWLKLGPMPMVMLCDPELTYRVLKDDNTFDKGGPFFDRLSDLFGDGVGTCPRSKHRRLRRLVQPAFRPAQMQRYEVVMREEADRMVESWNAGGDFDVSRASMAYTGRIVFRTLFSASLTEELLNGALTDLDDFVAEVPRRMLTPDWMARLPLPSNRRWHRTIAGLRDAVDGIIEQRRRQTTTDESDLLASMILSHDEEGGWLTDAELTDQAVTFLATGTETSATTLAWAMYLLATHPKVQQDLRDQVSASGPTSLSDSENDTTALCHRIIHESLRMYTPPWMLTRVTTTDTTLGEHHIPAGTAIAYSPYIPHRNPDLYPDPDTFDPDRWIARSPSTPCSFLPFGDGPRGCIGNRFAYLELTAALQAIAARWELHTRTDDPLHPRIGTTVAPHGLRLRVTA
ncbi:cytochrome P450 [Nocardia huaxiensis]|uniref:cytochrome P450 n=1 Tax=Nocardia huaxiensis TaxID=2755382 RepID=UPI001E65366A|nr:cytochrome P450 [Nocardia huaxiensis]UFS93089.1 cytochrome P450 [Nocardia huaxiensis]